MIIAVILLAVVVLLAGTLLKSFTGKGLVDAQLTTTANYRTAVALGAGLTVLLATRLGMPISTTHGLTGTLIGAGWAADSTINLHKLGSGFLAPLMVSPFLALGVTAETCLCVGGDTVEVVPESCIATTLAMPPTASSGELEHDRQDSRSLVSHVADGSDVWRNLLLAD